MYFCEYESMYVYMYVTLNQQKRHIFTIFSSSKIFKKVKLNELSNFQFNVQIDHCIPVSSVVLMGFFVRLFL